MVRIIAFKINITRLALGFNKTIAIIHGGLLLDFSSTITFKTGATIQQ